MVVYGIWTFCAAILAFVISAVVGRFLIPYLHKLNFGQTILEIGPSWHKEKQGTPVMGGIMFIIAITFVTIVSTVVYILTGSEFINTYRADISSEVVYIFAGLGLALANGIIGFVDDYTKVVKKRNLGLTAPQKLVFQFASAAAYLAILGFSGCGTETIIPFVGKVDLGFFYYIISAVVIVGIVNAVNLTDGVDGLDGSITFFVAVAVMLISSSLLSRSHRVQRGGCRCVSRLPCLEFPPCQGIHGRHRFALPRRRCLCLGVRHQNAHSAAAARHCVSLRNVLGYPAGGLLQADPRQAPFQDEPDSPSF